MKRIVGILFILVIFISFTMDKNSNDIKVSYIDEEVLLADVSSVNTSTYYAIDGLGREMPASYNKSSNHYRAVGVFYWPWHLELNKGRVINVNNVNKDNPSRKNDYNWWTQNYNTVLYWWNEPIYGYYLENDDYVLRKQAELLADAGVDFIVFDCTNGTYTWKSGYENLLKVWKSLQNQGVNVPKIAFMLQFDYSNNTYISFMDIYNNLYKPGTINYNNYNQLFYNYNGKPLILLNADNAPSDMKSLLQNFEVRKVESTYFVSGAQSNGTWGWLSSYPQAYYKKVNGGVEQISVGVAQNANYTNNTLTAMNGNNVMGRSYAKDNYSYSYTYKNKTITVGNNISGSTAKSTNTSLYGRNFQQQWDYALKTDPEIVFVTGWNEWVMYRFEDLWGIKNAFPDEFNDEYSRDIEPSKGELKDYYYYQLVENIRKYKGVTKTTFNNKPVTINSTSDWNNSNITTYDHYTGGNNRNVYGFGVHNAIRNSNITFRNDIKKAKVSYDSSNIYFYVETVNNLTSYNSDKWMRLLIDVKSSITSSDTDNWEEYEYILNRVTGTSSKLIIEKSNGGWNFTKVGEVSYKVNGKTLEITIPRELIGQTNKNINFNFKWCDNNLSNGDIMTVYTDGDSAPGARFSLHFEGISAYVKETKKKGDVNGDGKVNASDYILIRKHLIGIKLTGDNLSRADVNKDNKVNSKDYIEIRKIIIGL
jgi:hypothetical protein